MSYFDFWQQHHPFYTQFLRIGITGTCSMSHLACCWMSLWRSEGRWLIRGMMTACLTLTGFYSVTEWSSMPWWWEGGTGAECSDMAHWLKCSWRKKEGTQNWQPQKWWVCKQKVSWFMIIWDETDHHGVCRFHECCNITYNENIWWSCSWETNNKYNTCFQSICLCYKTMNIGSAKMPCSKRGSKPSE